jgi:CDP-paratose 2-epimerase
MSIAIVTGSSGLVGSEAVEFFSKKGFDVVGIDNNYRKYFFGKKGDTNWRRDQLIKKIKNFTHINCDIRNFNKLKKIFLKNKRNIKIVIHAAAQPSHDWAIKEPRTDYFINAIGTLNILELTKLYASDAVFILVSTNKVYGDTPNKINFIELKNRWDLKKKDKLFNGIDENMSIDHSIHSLFGVSKCSADILVQEYGKNIGLKTGIFRAGCITGPNHSGAELHGFLNYLVKVNLKKKIYNIYGYKGKQVRDNIHSYDLINAFWHFFKSPHRGEVYNIGGSRENSCSILEAINLIENISNIKTNYKIQENNRVGDHKWYISNLGKFKTHYKNFNLKYSLKQIIEEIVYNSR